MGRKAYTEPQYLYRVALYLFTYIKKCIGSGLYVYSRKCLLEDVSERRETCRIQNYTKNRMCDIK